MIISFAWTTEALLAGRKDVTRRWWTDEYARRFPPGSVHDAYNRSPRFKGKRVASIRVVTLHREPLRVLLEDPEYAAEEIRREGGLWPSVNDFVGVFLPERDPRGPFRLEFKLLDSIPLAQLQLQFTG